MERRAEINRFAIFLFCLMVPLGSLAPTKTSERKLSTAEWQKSFTTDIQPMSLVIGDHAHDLFEFYKKCVSETLPPQPENISSKARDMVNKIRPCPAFHANCCALHDIYNILQTLGSDMETLCKESPKNVIMANLNQLNTTLSHGAAFYTCKGQDPPQDEAMSLAETKTFIGLFLKRYKDIMKTAV